MKNLVSKIIFIFFDVIMIALAIYLASILYREITSVSQLSQLPISWYIKFYPLYIFPIIIFAYEGIYSYRYDFWHESRLILKGIFMGGFIIFAYIAMTKFEWAYSRLVVGFSLLFMAILIPLSKNILKKFLYKIGLWRQAAKIYSNDPFLSKEIYENHYLGYIKPYKNQNSSTVFINSKEYEVDILQEIITTQIQQKTEVIFIPLVDQFDLTNSHIYELSNTRTNLIVLQNRLKNKFHMFFKKISNFILAIFILPLITPVMLFIGYKIKKTEPKSKIIFAQERLGKDGSVFMCYKFRTMYENSDGILDEYLAKNPSEVKNYKRYHKYKNDPRITPIGHFLRKTSLDELPQIFNVLRLEMDLIGPRPYMIEEKKEMGEYADVVLGVNPGITGLWQVSGRSDLDFESRVKLDLWYIRNWNPWLDVTILLKTIKIVLLRKGAK